MTKNFNSTSINKKNTLTKTALLKKKNVTLEWKLSQKQSWLSQNKVDFKLLFWAKILHLNKWKYN